MRYGTAARWLLTGMMCLLAPVTAAEDAKVSPLMAKDLAGLTGKEGVMLTVEYAPGGSSAKHRHNAHTFVYVLEGSIVMQVEGGTAVTLGPGQTFYESPDDVHAVVVGLMFVKVSRVDHGWRFVLVFHSLPEMLP